MIFSRLVFHGLPPLEWCTQPWNALRANSGIAGSAKLDILKSWKTHRSLVIVGKRFAHQRFADSREKLPISEALGQIRANRVFSPIRIEIRVIRVQSSLLSHFFGRSIRKKKQVFFLVFFFFFSKRGSIRAIRPTKHRRFDVQSQS